MNEPEFRDWLFDDHMASFPGLKNWFEKLGDSLAANTRRTWFSDLKRYSVTALRQSTAELRQRSTKPLYENHPRELAQIAQRIDREAEALRQREQQAEREQALQRERELVAAYEPAFNELPADERQRRVSAVSASPVIPEAMKLTTAIVKFAKEQEAVTA